MNLTIKVMPPKEKTNTTFARTFPIKEPPLIPLTQAISKTPFSNGREV
jgi:hypothetical protein